MHKYTARPAVHLSGNQAYSRRAADGDVEALTLMTGLADELDAAIAEAVKGLRSRGYSWAEIGSRLGITRQAAQQRWGQQLTRPVPHTAAIDGYLTSDFNMRGITHL